MTVQPIFIFSITRSGSTLAQRVIAAHDGVSTASEPWLLLPYLYTLRERGVVAEYTHPLMAKAIDDFCQVLPDGRSDYYQELHDFVIRLYTKAAGPEALYFLDKSPPYYFVADDIMRLFPEGKFIFLWRNPLSILSSIIETWQDGLWRATTFREDLFIGLPRLISTYRASTSRAHAVRMEDLLGDGDRPWRDMMTYLELEFDPQVLSRFAEVRLAGRMGDHTGVRQYAAIDPEPIEKWKQTLANPLRRAWARRYLRFIGDDRLATMGYNADELIRALDAQPMRATSLLPDLLQLTVDLLKEPIRAQVRRRGVGGPNPIRELLKA